MCMMPAGARGGYEAAPIAADPKRGPCGAFALWRSRSIGGGGAAALFGPGRRQFCPVAGTGHAGCPNVHARASALAARVYNGAAWTPNVSKPPTSENTARRQMTAITNKGDDRAPGGGNQSVDVVQDDDMDVPTPLEYNMSTMPADYTLETLHQKWRSGDIKVPKFQRGYAWSTSQASKLIESFMMGLPVPPVFLSAGDDERSTVIDGMQRLATVFSYLDGRYPDDSPHRGKRFRITGINESSRLYGKTFWDLCGGDQRRLKNTVLRATIVTQNGPKGDDSGMREVFERLNAGGTSLAAQEVRSGLYAGALNDALAEMNGDKDWRDIVGKPRPDPRMKDVEMILRYVALFHAEGSYAPPMKSFLSGFMAGHKNPGDGFINGERTRFAKICRAVRGELGPEPFANEHGQLRMPLFDSVFVAFAHGGCRCPGDIRERFDALQGSEEFAGCSSKATTSASSIKGRLRLAREILFG